MQSLWRLVAAAAGVVVCASGDSTAQYQFDGAVRGSMVARFTVTTGPEWVLLEATKGNGEQYAAMFLGSKRYLFREGAARWKEYRNALTGEAVLPSQGTWDLLPVPLRGLPEEVRYLGHVYRRSSVGERAALAAPADVDVVSLRPDMLIGQASNTRQKDETRRFDGSDYQLVRLTREDYRLMREAGVTCVRVDGEQAKWADELGLYYWGGGKELPFPELLYRSQYLGPALFLDEPAVGTRDHVARPRFAKDEAYRKAMTPQVMFEEFRKYYDHALKEGAPAAFEKGLRARTDVDLGDLRLRQENLYSWETMVSTAAYQLSQDPKVPNAMVFEPPGRIGTRRTLPEIDMSYGVEFPPDDPKALASVIFGFLRGAARATQKQWGTSIYGAFDRADSAWWLTHAYDLGATRFFFWDNYQLACVPFGEVLALSRHLREHARTHPRPSIEALRGAGEVAILLPPGYDLGHVQTGKGHLWGIPELNLERVNRRGVTHRMVMSSFFKEIERCVKLGIPYDLLWDLPGLHVDGYREVVRVQEDASVVVTGAVLQEVRTPPRAGGERPRLSVTVRVNGLEVEAKARVEETAAKVFYTFGADDEGVYQNALVAWEIYGPEEQDQLVLLPDKLRPRVALDGHGGTAEVRLSVKGPGKYRLRAATVDSVGRSTVVWTAVQVGQ